MTDKIKMIDVQDAFMPVATLRSRALETRQPEIGALMEIAFLALAKAVEQAARDAYEDNPS